MSRKLFFRVDHEEESCYELSYWYDVMAEEKLDEIKVYKAQRMSTISFFWCQYDVEAYEKDDQTCGKLNCSNYKPRNGKWGMCKYFSPCYEAIGKEITLTKD